MPFSFLQTERKMTVLSTTAAYDQSIALTLIASICGAAALALCLYLFSDLMMYGTACGNRPMGPCTTRSESDREEFLNVQNRVIGNVIALFQTAIVLAFLAYLSSEAWTWDVPISGVSRSGLLRVLFWIIVMAETTRYEFTTRIPAVRTARIALVSILNIILVVFLVFLSMQVLWSSCSVCPQDLMEAIPLIGGAILLFYGIRLLVVMIQANADGIAYFAMIVDFTCTVGTSIILYLDAALTQPARETVIIRGMTDGSATEVYFGLTVMLLSTYAIFSVFLCVVSPGWYILSKVPLHYRSSLASVVPSSSSTIAATREGAANEKNKLNDVSDNPRAHWDEASPDQERISEEKTIRQRKSVNGGVPAALPSEWDA